MKNSKNIRKQNTDYEKQIPYVTDYRVINKIEKDLIQIYQLYFFTLIDKWAKNMNKQFPLRRNRNSKYTPEKMFQPWQ